MPHSAEAVDSPSLQSASPGMQPWSQEVGRESCVEEILEFTDRFRQNVLRKHLGAAAFPQHIPSDGHDQPLFCQDIKQQHRHWQRPEGIGAAARAFGGLSFDECMMVFLAPNARFCLPAAPPNLSSLTSPPPASQAPPPSSQASTFSAVAASPTEFPFAQDYFPLAAASNPNAAALRRPLKRPRHEPLLRARKSGWLPGGVVRGGWAGSTERRHQSVAEQFQQQGESSGVQQVGARSHVQQQSASSCMQAEEEALLEALLQDCHQQQGGAGIRVLCPRVGSESALPPLPPPMPSHLAALPASTPRTGGFAAQRVDSQHVGSESALPDDMLLGFCSEDSGFTQCAALSAPPPTQPHTALPAPMPSHVPSPPGPTLRGSSSCITATLAGSMCGTEEQQYEDTCINALSDGNNTDDNSNSNGDALFLDMLLGGSALAEPLATIGPQQLALAAPSADGAAPAADGVALQEWVVEQGGTREGGAHLHGQQHFLDQETTLAQWEFFQRLELERTISLPRHQALPLSLPQPLSKALMQSPLLSAPSQLPIAPGATGAPYIPSIPRGSHMQALIQPRPAMLLQPFSLGALPSLCRAHAVSVAQLGCCSGR
ncbi:unnamed protein product [Closterium sp. Yama58-4]|nr:unnamed protein product [Closterium sp. Yama58-4]